MQKLVSKDAVLDRTVMYTICLFCVATEVRFQGTVLDDSYLHMKESDMYHSKSLHIASIFLPNDCPLSKHILDSYVKHHLTPKLDNKGLNNSRVSNCEKQKFDISDLDPPELKESPKKTKNKPVKYSKSSKSKHSTKTPTHLSKY